MNLFELLGQNKTTPPLKSKKGIFVVDDTVGISLLIASQFKQEKDKYLIVTSNLYKAQQIFNLLYSFIGEENIQLFPQDELIRAESIAQSKEMTAQRLAVLDSIIKNKAKIIITNISGATRYLPKEDLFKKNTLNFKVGDTYDLLDIKKQLVKAGYYLVNKVDSSLQFASRGDILDIFSVGEEDPIRIEFFGDEIESIRYFDIATQVSKKKINKVTVLPGSDILLTDDEIATGINRIKDKIAKNNEFLPLKSRENIEYYVNRDIDKILESNLDESIYKYFSFISDNVCSIFDYCHDFIKVMVDQDQLESSNQMLQGETWAYLNELYESGKAINGLSTHFDITKLVHKNDEFTIWTRSISTSEKDVVFNCTTVPYQSTKKTDALNIVNTYINDNYKVIIAVDSKEHVYLSQEMLDSDSITYEYYNDLEVSIDKNVSICLYPLSSGFVLPDDKVVVLTPRELFNIKVKTGRIVNKFKEATILKSYEDLNPGDYVVHEFQGIGQFLELTTLEIEGAHRDFLKIAYFGNEFLYVPLSQFQLVRKYIGKEGFVPRLSHLHSKDWENQKKKIKEKINDLAERLMNLYTERSKIKGFAFQKDDEFQEQFESNFAHQLTPDQERSLKDIKEDMESDRPMDRLLCGDVGFGKTEIAFRAAFKAILSGKQVAMLCPTTLLARQHYELALERFGPFEVNVGHLSRLVPESKQKEYIEQAANGKLHLLIGTHKLLSKNVSFKELGLLIVDEEQRFGVEQKEKIKEMKTNLDVLTLSATPIPRTLQISLLGVRQLSQINTPPNERMPIQTYVTPFNWNIVKELIERELGRDGQVFFLHNEVVDIYQVAGKLQKMIPMANVGVVHGQMNKDDIEELMDKFYSGEINVLVCTSIVENGIDVPNANMIIVQDSERYGLSQLYQIKGRVGRSDRIAYAYLMYPEHKKLTENTKKRLKALQDFTELGSGYKIAQRDLMIRGAGDILGPEQAGFIDNIGLDMYIKLLNEAVKEKMGQAPEVSKEGIKITNLSVDAYIPSSYASDSDKIELYQEINSCETIEQLLNIKQKMIDIYGKPPSETELLFDKRRIDILSKEAMVKSLVEQFNQVVITLKDNFSTVRGIGNMLFEILIPYIAFTRIVYKNHEFVITINKQKQWIKHVEGLLESLLNLCKTNNLKEE